MLNGKSYVQKICLLWYHSCKEGRWKIYTFVYVYVCTSILAFFLNLFIFMAVLGLPFCARALSSCGKQGPLFIAVRGPLTIAASLVAEHRLQTRRLSSCGSRAQPLRVMWDLPRPGFEPVSPALAGRLSTTAPPGKPYTGFYMNRIALGEKIRNYNLYLLERMGTEHKHRRDTFHYMPFYTF